MKIDIDRTDLLNLVNIKLGLYKPISKLCSETEYKSIIQNYKIKNSFYPIPFNLYGKKSLTIEPSNKSHLFYKKKLVGNFYINTKISHNLEKHNKNIFGTNDKNHLGVKLYSKKIKSKPNFLGGSFKLTNYKIIKKIFKENFESVKEIKKIKNKKNYVVFSTRNIIHSGHNLIIDKLLEKQKKVLIVVLLSEKKKLKKNLLKKFYKQFLKQEKYFLNVKVNFLEIPTFFAGPREASFQCKIFENLGFGFFYVGRDHAGYKNYYSKFSSQDFTKKLNLKIKIIGFNEPMYCLKCDKTVLNKLKLGKRCNVCKSDNLKNISGTLIRKNIKQSKSINKLFSTNHLSFVKKHLL